MREPVRPIRQFFIGAAAAVADQRDVVAKAFFDHSIGQFDAGVETFGILEFGTIEQ